MFMFEFFIYKFKFVVSPFLPTAYKTSTAGRRDVCLIKCNGGFDSLGRRIGDVSSIFLAGSLSQLLCIYIYGRGFYLLRGRSLEGQISPLATILLSIFYLTYT